MLEPIDLTAILKMTQPDPSQGLPGSASLKARRSSSQPSSILTNSATQSSYTLDTRLGHGGFSTVKLDKARGLAIKIIPFIPKLFHGRFALFKQKIDEEITILKHLGLFHDVLYRKGNYKVRDDENQVIRQYHHVDKVYIIMDYVPGHDLFEFLKTQSLTPYQQLILAINFLKCLQSLHLKNVIHGDLKLENVMVKPNLEAALVDFGQAKICPEGCYVEQNPILTYQTSPPEAHQHGLFSFQGDIYSSGWILARIFNLVRPTQSLQSPTGVVFQLTPPRKDNILYPIHQLIRQMLSPNFKERPSLEKIISFLGRIKYSIHLHQFNKITSRHPEALKNPHRAKSSLFLKKTSNTSRLKRQQSFTQGFIQDVPQKTRCHPKPALPSRPNKKIKVLAV